MGIKLATVCCFAISLGALAGKGYEATTDQACTYVSVDLGIYLGLMYFLGPYFDLENPRELAMIDLSTRMVSCMAGVLATHLTCEKAIQWRQAIVAQLTYRSVVAFLYPVLPDESDATLKLFSQKN